MTCSRDYRFKKHILIFDDPGLRDVERQCAANTSTIGENAYATKLRRVNRGLAISSGVDLTFATHRPETREANVKSKTPLETYIC